MNKDIAQLIAFSIDNEETLYSFALVCKCTAEGVRRITPIKKLEFEMRRKHEFREGMIDMFRSLFVVGAKGVEYLAKPTLNLTGQTTTFSQKVNDNFSTPQGRELLGKLCDKWGPDSSLSPEYKCVLIMLIPLLSYIIDNNIVNS
jgi:hypothetical protein